MSATATNPIAIEPGSRKDRFAGSLLGLAVGDALGASVEFRPPGTFEPLTETV